MKINDLPLILVEKMYDFNRKHSNWSSELFFKILIINDLKKKTT